MRLKIANMIFNNMIGCNKGEDRIKAVGDTDARIRKIKLESKARIMLDTGPAREIMALSLFGFSRLKGSNCTGLPQPNLTNKIIRVPKGSRWLKGFKVSR